MSEVVFEDSEPRYTVRMVFGGRETDIGPDYICRYVEEGPSRQKKSRCIHCHSFISDCHHVQTIPEQRRVISSEELVVKIRERSRTNGLKENKDNDDQDNALIRLGSKSKRGSGDNGNSNGTSLLYRKRKQVRTKTKIRLLLSF